MYKLLSCALFALMIASPRLLISQTGYQIPVTYYKLPNGLKVAMSKDTTAPIVTVAVYYNIGFRIEPKNRTGFAHLFEHMMFQGSRNLPKGEFDKLINGSGGTNNGSTRFDYTNYFEIVPSHTLEPILWSEADRMKGLLLNQANLLNQQGVVTNEVLGNVINQPYGGFPWLDMPQYANTNWYNAHNFYGELKDLEAATLADVKEFFRLYYAPNNAVLAITGDYDEAQTKAWIEKYFAKIPAVKQPAKPDITEPRQEKEKRFSKVDKLANRPALGLAYHIPERNTPEHYAMVLLDILMLNGDDALLRQELVNNKGYSGSVDGGINLLGTAFNYNGPMLWIVNLIHDKDKSADTILASYDSVVEKVQTEGISPAALTRAKVKFRAQFYQGLADLTERADAIATFAMYDDRPDRVNEIEPAIGKVTPQLVQKVAQEYLRKTNRTILTIEAGAEKSAQQGGR
jgi:zinc protease